jgi:mannosyltransferase
MMNAFSAESLDDLPATRSRRSRALGTGALLLVAALAVAFRLPYLTERSLWYDEASSWQTAKFPFNEMMASVRLNVHMPLYYLLLKGWMAVFGESVAALRGFSVAFGALTVVAMSLFGRELYRASSASDADPPSRVDGRAETFGLVLAGLVAVSPCQVFASIEARMYSLGTFLAATSSWLLLRVLREPDRAGLWLAYGLAFAALPYAHHYGLLTAGAQALFLGLYLVQLAASGEREAAVLIFRRALVVAAVAALIYLPGLEILRLQTSRVQQDYWVRPLSWTIFFGTFNEFILPRPDYDQLPHGWIACSGFAVACLAVARRGRRGDAFVLAMAVVPMVLSAAASTVTPVWVGRYFRFTQLFVLATVALAAWSASGRLRALRIGLFVALYTGLIAANVAFWKTLDLENGRGIRGAVEYVMDHRLPGETIVALDALQYFPAKYYFAGRAPVRMVEPAVDLFWGWHLIRPDDLITQDRLDADLDRGVWLIGTLPNPAVTPGLTSRKPLNNQSFTYYNHLHARVFVHHYRGGESEGP